MPIQYRIDAEEGIIYTEIVGTLTDAELLRHKQALLDDPDFQPGMRELSDVRGVDKLEITPETIRKLASFDRAHADRLGDHRLALVVPGDFVFGMARMYEQSTTDQERRVGVFRDEAGARAWLGMEPAEGA